MDVSQFSTRDLIDQYWYFVDFPREQIKHPEEWAEIKAEIIERKVKTV